ncbi:hypothetical protein [Streptomyces sp. SAS_275]|uniref:hypothetical protein n=1 Tax=Streptomyces sp. SAS_275 TaxID=3412746 RepID=UPI00403C1EC2
MTDVATGTIYALIDPRTETVRYVGQTTKPIEVRLAGHLAAPAPLVRSWIEELAVEGRRPGIIPIREGVPTGELDSAEREEIAAHSAIGDLLNVVSNVAGNAKRRKASREEAKRREAEEKAMDLSWRQASWRLVADQVRAATGGPIPPSDVPLRSIPEPVWATYRSYREADNWLTAHPGDGYLLVPGVGLTATEDSPEARERQEIRQLRQRCADGLEDFMRTFCRSFVAVDDGERYGDGVFGQGDDAYKVAFSDSTHMARYLSLIPWAARSLDPWVALAEAAGIDRSDAAFAEWVSDDPDTRAAVMLFQEAGTPHYLGRHYDRWDTDIPSFALALGAAHIPGFVIPDLLRSDLRERLVKVAQDRQATDRMCKLLQEIDPRALDTVYGKDRLAVADAELGLPAGLAAQVIANVFGTEHRDPNSEIGKLLQRNAGTFQAPAVPEYADWSGIHIPAVRSAVACFCAAGLFEAAEDGLLDAVIERSKRTWMPGGRGLEVLEEVEQRLQAKLAA